MKKIIALAALAVLVSSCGNKMTLMKRHYTKGFYLHHSGNATRPEAHASAVSVTEEIAPVAVNSVSEETQAPEMVATIRPVVAAKKTAHSFQSQIAVQSNAHKSWIQKMPFVSLKKHSMAFSESKKQQRAGGGDSNLIVQVILALFPILCLIAVYLHDGGITTNFWVTLVLHLLIYLECIFALLVVLGAINLA